MEKKIPVIIDTDLGDDIDDAFALCLAAQSPEIQLLGVTTVHRCPQYRAKMAKALLNAAGMQVPVHAGIAKPLKVQTVHGKTLNYTQKPLSWAEEFASIEYDGNDAVDFLVKTIESSQEKVTLVTLGALTNVATLIMRRPDLKEKIQLSIMGGAFLRNWGEYNFSCDPDAADIILQSGIQARCVGIDITFQCKLSGDLLGKIANHTHPCLQMLSRMRCMWEWGVLLHDPLALMSVFDPSFVTWEKMVCAVETQGKCANGYVVNFSDSNFGQDASSSNLSVGIAVDSDRFVREYVRRVSSFEKESCLTKKKCG